VCAPVGHDLADVLQVPGAAHGDDGHARQVGHRADELAVEARPGAVTVDVVHQDLPDPESVDCAYGRGEVVGHDSAAVVRGDLVVATQARTTRVDDADDALRAVPDHRLTDHRRVVEQERGHRYLLDPHVEETVEVLDRTDPAAVADWHEALGNRLLDEVDLQRLPLGGGIDVEEEQLVDRHLVVDAGRVDGVADVAALGEPFGLDQARARDEERRYDASSQHRRQTSAKARMSAIPK
jgi:hypothetical protein